MYSRALAAIFAAEVLQGVELVRVRSEQEDASPFQRGYIAFLRDGQSDRPGCPVTVGWPRSSP